MKLKNKKLILYLIIFSCIITAALAKNSAIQVESATYAIHLEKNNDELLETVANIYSKNMILVNLDNGKVIGEICGEDRIYPASLTKIMTTIVCLEQLADLSETITLEEGMFNELYEEGASMAGFSPDDKVKAIDLLYGVMLSSGADAAVGLANKISGTEEDFVKLMNREAEKLGMENTHFVNCTGLHDDAHYSTLEDLVKLLQYALKNDIFREIFTTKTHVTSGGLTLTSTMFEKLEVWQMNNEYILGGKTGYTGEAGLCLASIAEINGNHYLLITANAKGSSNTEPYHIQDAISIFNSIEE